MSRTKRTGYSKTTRRIVPLLAGAAVAVTSVVLLYEGSATASAKTVTVSFTADGPSPASVTLNPGDTVIYRNDVNPNDQALLGAVGGAIRTVNVEVTGAAQTPFVLSAGKTRALTYQSPVAATYNANLEPTMLLGIVPGQTVTTTGKIMVKDAASDTPPPTASPAPPPSSPAAGAPAPSGNTDPADQNDGQSDQSGEGQAGSPSPQVNYTPQAGNPAAGQVPTGGAGAAPGATATPSSGAEDTLGAPDTGTDSSTDSQATLPEIGGTDDNGGQTKAVSPASNDSALNSLGVPAITAVVLLSMVSAGLVRMIMVRNTSLA